MGKIVIRSTFESVIEFEVRRSQSQSVTHTENTRIQRLKRRANVTQLPLSGQLPSTGWYSLWEMHQNTLSPSHFASNLYSSCTQLIQKQAVKGFRVALFACVLPLFSLRTKSHENWLREREKRTTSSSPIQHYYMRLYMAWGSARELART